MVASTSLPAANTTQPQPATATAQARHSRFHLLLSELNPLQYLPVVGTIYRAITGDVIPEDARFAGSLVVSGLTSGPVGIAVNLGISALEKLIGINPEAIGERFMADLGIGHVAGPAAAAAPLTADAPTKTAPAIPAGALPTPAKRDPPSWAPIQLAAYRRGPYLTGPVSDADILNYIELTRLQSPKRETRVAAVA